MRLKSLLLNGALVLLMSAQPSFGEERQTSQSPAQVSSESSADTAELYIFNDSGWTLFPGDQVVTDNDRRLVSLPRQTYAKLQVTSGPHLLKPDPPLWKQEVRLDVKPGKRYFVVVAYKPERSWAVPFAGAPLVLTEITEEQALPLLKDMKSQ